MADFFSAMSAIAIINLGCPKNEVDAEKIAWLLQAAGFHLIDEAARAEIIIVNTCAFIQPAVEEAIEVILENAAYKASGSCRRLIVCGCLPQRYGAELLAEIPEIDFMFGSADFFRIAEVLRLDTEQMPASPLHLSAAPDYGPCQDIPQLLGPPAGSAYLKLSEGCNNNCSYCMIPRIKGKLQSVPLDRLLSQASRLTEAGAVELNLIAQDITVYGLDLYGRTRLPELLIKLCRNPALQRLRLLYAYPARVDRELISLIRDEEKICNYLDLPIQHISRKILKAMGRPDDPENLRRTLDQLKSGNPELYLRSTVIVGFPGEEEKHFRELLDLVAEGFFDYLGVFPYWPEAGSRAAGFADQVEDAVKQERRERIIETQQMLTRKRLRREIGCRHRLLIAGLSRETELLLEGRTAFQAPDIDGLTYITEGQAEAGRLVEAEIIDAHDIDLFARIV
ncbi:MAG: 30S ribosomal protein S12 methylthiotransferase RimO [Deltaproteobacteria bacterium]|nr:30S ribosomal protein S12 methylthiotransferase RimO [Deltaproteobacteria bacterium]